ncbi:MAG TPA: DUF4185 domain-containing protein [Armatimonadota bacterium]|jgi:hypothetical protein
MRRLLVTALLAALAGAAGAAPRVEKVENGGLLFTDNPAGVSGTDAGFSAPIGDRTLWLFGDVFLLHPTDPAKHYVGDVSNCALLVGKGSGASPLKSYRFLTDAKTGLARPVIQREGGEDGKTRLWPGASWFDASRNRLYTFYGIITILGEGTYNFRSEGQGLAMADTSHPGALAYKRLKAADGDYWWRGVGPTFGAAVVPRDGYLYIAGQADAPGKPGKMARVLKSRIADPAAYEYYTGGAAAPRWSRKLADAANVEGLAGFPSELSISWNAYLGGYLAAHSILLDDRIRLSIAPYPWGPYRRIADIGAPRQALQKNPCYAGKEHPELAERGGKVIFITYVDSQRYWLQLLKVTLAK